jgi:hypothetical protein
MPLTSAGTMVDVFGGTTAPVGDMTMELTPSPRLIPAGFDAIAQFDHSFLESQLRRNMLHEGLLLLEAEMPYDRETAPPALRAVVESPLRPPLPIGTDRFIEVRLTDPRLATLRSGVGPDAALLPIEDMVVTSGEAAPVGAAALSERSLGVVETTWTVEVNLLLRIPGDLPGDVVVSEPSPSAAPIDVAFGERAAAGRGRVRHTRETLARGIARVPATTVRVRRHDRGQFWIRIDVGSLEPQIDTDDRLMRIVLADDLGSTLLTAALAPLVDDISIRLTPRLALAGNGESLPGPALDFSALVLQHNDGREVLSLCIDAGIGSPGSPKQVQSFVGDENYAYYVSAPVAERVISTRWRSRPGLRTFVGDIPVDLAESGNPEQTHQGLARVRVRLEEAMSGVDIRPSESDFGDPLRVIGEQEIKLLNVWDHEGNELTDLGELEEPASLPFVWLIYPFDRDPSPGVTSPGKRRLAKLAAEVTSPLFHPFVEELISRRLRGYTSSALGAIFVRGELFQPQVGPTGPAPPPPPPSDPVE